MAAGVFLFNRVPNLAEAAQGTYDCTEQYVVASRSGETKYVLEIGDGTWKETWEGYTRTGTWRIENGKLIVRADPVHQYHVTEEVVIDGVPARAPEAFHGVVPGPIDSDTPDDVFTLFDVTISNGGRHVEFTTNSASQLRYICDRR